MTWFTFCSDTSFTVLGSNFNRSQRSGRGALVGDIESRITVRSDTPGTRSPILTNCIRLGRQADVPAALGPDLPWSDFTRCPSGYCQGGFGHRGRSSPHRWPESDPQGFVRAPGVFVAILITLLRVRRGPAVLRPLHGHESSTSLGCGCRIRSSATRALPINHTVTKSPLGPFAVHHDVP